MRIQFNPSPFRKRVRFALAKSVVVPALALLPMFTAAASNFSTGTAIRFGVYEIALIGDGAVANPFDTIATVKFVPPSGEKNARTVHAFYDGDNAWRARVYVSEIGAWIWSSDCATDNGLHGKTGTFKSADSRLRGRLLPHPKNPRYWITEDGRWFLHVGDTAYFLLSSYDENGQHITDDDMAAYVRDAVDRGITSFLAYAVSGPGGCFDEDARRWTDAYFEDASFSRLRLNLFQCSDRRLLWLLQHYPDVSIQLILFPRGSAYQADERFWDKLSVAQKERVLRQMIARYAAFPQLTWIVACDAHYGKEFPKNNAMAREVGAYFRKHDPWQHPMSTHHARFLDFQFADEDWATYIFLENAYDVGASQYAKYHRFAKPVLLGEDRYEQYDPDRDPIDMGYFQRRQFWAWLLSGGSANYGGRWWVLHPYTQTGERASSHRSTLFKAPLRGLDSVKFIREFFEKRKIELSDFEPDHDLARDVDGATGARSPKLMRRNHEEYLVYHPNAATDGREARADAVRTARMQLDLTNATRTFQIEWLRVHDGVAFDAGTISSGAVREFIAPWKGHDVVLRLIAKVD